MDSNNEPKSRCCQAHPGQRQQIVGTLLRWESKAYGQLMGKINIGYLSMGLYLPGCSSLKEKRGRIKPIIARIQREFKISAAELNHQDVWQSSLIGCVMVTGDPAVARNNLQKIPRWLEKNWPDIELVDEHIEIFSA